MSNSDYDESDETDTIHPYLLEIVDKPHILRPQGEILEKLIRTFADIYENTTNDIAESIISMSYDEFLKKVKTSLKRIKKLNNKRNERFIPYNYNNNGEFIFDKKGNKTVIKQYNIRSFWLTVYSNYIKDEDLTNTTYF